MRKAATVREEILGGELTGAYESVCQGRSRVALTMSTWVRVTTILRECGAQFSLQQRLRNRL